MGEIDVDLLREAGISENGSSRNGSRSVKEGESGRHLSKLIAVCEMPEPDARRYVIPGLLPEGALTILYGDGGLGKSYLALYLAMCAVLGVRFAERSVEKRNAIYLNAELDQDEFVRRAYSVARGLGLGRPPEGLYYWRLPGSLNDPRVREQALDCMRQCGAGFAVIDSLTVASFGIDPKEARDIIGLLKGLEAFDTVLAIDHIRTPEPGGDTSAYRPFGSAFKHHLARSLLMVTKAASGAIAIRNTKANFDEKSAPIYLSLDFDNDNRATNVEWLEPGDERLASMDAISAEERIVQALARNADGTSTAQALAQELGLASKTVSNHLTALKVKHRVEPLGDHRWRFLPDAPF